MTILQCLAAGAGFGLSASLVFALTRVIGGWLGPSGQCSICGSYGNDARCAECRKPDALIPEDHAP